MSTKQRYYWLGSDEASSQDTFFLEALDQSLWSPGNAENWDTCWCVDMPDNDVFSQLQGHKTINHIPGNSALTIKSELDRTLNAARNKMSKELRTSRYDFFPTTYSMPEDYFTFQEAAKKHPEYMWIQKPKNLSRGRGIEMVQHPACVPLGDSWMVQQYQANPHLYQGHKYVLRCYVLVTSVEPLRCYFYHEGFAKLASESYSSDDLENPYRHLTNPDINEDNTDSETPVTFLSFAEYRQWLKDNGHDGEQLFTSLKDLITLTIIAAREEMREQCKDTNASTSGCYELIGLDCMVDEKLKPWVLECNLSPSMDTYANEGAGGDTEVIIKRQLLADLVSLIGLNESDDALATFTALPPAEKAIVESARSTHFECLFPNQQANDYLHCFPVPRYSDILAVPEATPVDLSRINTAISPNSEYLFDDSVAIFSNTTKELMLPNEIASWIWLKNGEGCGIQEIIDELAQATPRPEHMSNSEFEHSLQSQVWDVLADWSNSGVFNSATENNESIESHKTDSNKLQDSIHYLVIANTPIAINIACNIATAYLKPLLEYYRDQDFSSKERDNDLSVNILRSDYGYIILSNNNLIETKCTLATLTTVLFSTIIPNTKENSASVFMQGNVILLNGYHLLLINHSTDIADSLAYHLEKESAAQIISGTVKLTDSGATVIPTNYPLYLPIKGEFSSEHDNQHLVAMKCNTAYSLHTLKNTSDAINIDGVITLKMAAPKKDNATNSTTISPLTCAETMTALWSSCYNNHRINSSANTIAQWVNHTKGFELQCATVNDAIKNIEGFSL